jgi:hypothetical protein
MVVDPSSLLLERFTRSFPSAHLIVSRDFKAEHGLINSGFMVMRASKWALRLLRAWWDLHTGGGGSSTGGGHHNHGCNNRSHDRGLSDQGAFDLLWEQAAAAHHHNHHLPPLLHRRTALLEPWALNTQFPAWFNLQPSHPVLHLAGVHDELRVAVFKEGLGRLCSSSSSSSSISSAAAAAAAAAPAPAAAGGIGGYQYPQGGGIGGYQYPQGGQVVTREDVLRLSRSTRRAIVTEAIRSASKVMKSSSSNNNNNNNNSSSSTYYHGTGAVIDIVRGVQFQLQKALQMGFAGREGQQRRECSSVAADGDSSGDSDGDGDDSNSDVGAVGVEGGVIITPQMGVVAVEVEVVTLGLRWAATTLGSIGISSNDSHNSTTCSSSTDTGGDSMGRRNEQTAASGIAASMEGQQRHLDALFELLEHVHAVPSHILQRGAAAAVCDGMCSSDREDQEGDGLLAMARGLNSQQALPRERDGIATYRALATASLVEARQVLTSLHRRLHALSAARTNPNGDSDSNSNSNSYSDENSGGNANNAIMALRGGRERLLYYTYVLCSIVLPSCLSLSVSLIDLLLPALSDTTWHDSNHHSSPSLNQ